jgi:hypothetical protein
MREQQGGGWAIVPAGARGGLAHIVVRFVPQAPRGIVDALRSVLALPYRLGRIYTAGAVGAPGQWALRQNRQGGVRGAIGTKITGWTGPTRPRIIELARHTANHANTYLREAASGLSHRAERIATKDKQKQKQKQKQKSTVI